MGDDVAGEAVIVGALAEGDLGRDGAREIFVGDGVQAIVDLPTQRFAGVDLMTGDPDVHLVSAAPSGAALRPARRRATVNSPAGSDQSRFQIGSLIVARKAACRASSSSLGACGRGGRTIATMVSGS